MKKLTIVKCGTHGIHAVLITEGLVGMYVTPTPCDCLKQHLTREVAEIGMSEADWSFLAEQAQLAEAETATVPAELGEK